VIESYLPHVKGLHDFHLRMNSSEQSLCEVYHMKKKNFVVEKMKTSEKRELVLSWNYEEPQ